MIKKYLLPASLLLMTFSCVSPPATSNTDKPIASKPDTPAPSMDCRASNPKNVHMWINAMPGLGAGSRSPLHATFDVTTGTPGYQFALKVNRVMESSPEQVVLDLIATPPSGMVIQVVTQSKVNIKLADFPGSQGSSVQVNCGGKPFFKVDKVMTVH